MHRIVEIRLCGFAIHNREGDTKKKRMAQKKKNGAAEKIKTAKVTALSQKPQNAESAAKPAKGSVAEPKNEKKSVLVCGNCSQ